MPARLLLLGLDAASPVLLRRWASEGKLPAIARLIEGGTSGPVGGVRGFFIGSTWPSFYTGLNPAGHGFYRLDQLKCGTYDSFRPLESTSGMGGTPFWRLASDAGRRVAVLDVPLSRLEPDLNGLQTVEWGGHDAVFGFRASPRDVIDEVRSRVGEYPLPSNCDGIRRSAADFEQFVTGLELAVTKKAELTLALLGREEWDLFIQVFTEAHCAGHQCWHIHDPEHPAHDPHLLEVVGDPLERVYRAIDRAVAAIVERAGDAHVLLVAPHGMSHFRGAGFLLSEIMFRLGASIRPRARPHNRRGVRDRALSAARAAWRRLPEPARAAIRPLRSRLASLGVPGDRTPWLRMDVSKSMCFPVPNGSPVAGIRFNLAGREPLGVLHPGPATDAFCDSLSRELRGIINEETGRPLIADVYRTDTLYTGSRRDALPDLLVEWDGDTPIGSIALAGGRGATIRATSAGIGTLRGRNAYRRTGDHLPTGMFISCGPGVPAAKRHEAVSVMDFYPTICRLLDLPDPDVDGVVIPDLITPPRA